MTFYLRAYDDFSYEMIYLEGIFNKSRFHVLINPGRQIYLPGDDHSKDFELNISSLTHIISMETSIRDPNLILRTIRVAENTNKPIITNQETSKLLREHGLSIRQLRIIGFDEEVVEGIQIDPVYLEELSEEGNKNEEQGLFSYLFQERFLEKFKPKNWKLFNLGKENPSDIQFEIDPSKPLAFIIEFEQKIKVLLPLDRRGVNNANRIIPQFDPDILILINKSVAATKDLERGLHSVVILNDDFEDDQLLLVPKTHNPGIFHDTYLGGLNQWVEIP